MSSKEIGTCFSMLKTIGILKLFDATVCLLIGIKCVYFLFQSNKNIVIIILLALLDYNYALESGLYNAVYVPAPVLHLTIQSCHSWGMWLYFVCDYILSGIHVYHSASLAKQLHLLASLLITVNTPREECQFDNSAMGPAVSVLHYSMRAWLN